VAGEKILIVDDEESMVQFLSILLTKEGYDVERLIRLIRDFRTKWGVDVYLEPGEAVGWRTGPLVASVLDIVHNGMDIAILDTSATAHMPPNPTIRSPSRATR
jgi:carboxynorspermidine decarboxylase